MTRTISGKIHQLESEIRPGIKRELASLSARASHAMEAISPSASLSSAFGGRSTTKHGNHAGQHRDRSNPQSEDRPVVISGDDDDDEGWASDGSMDDAQETTGTKKSRKGAKPGGLHHVPSQVNRKGRRAIRRGSMSTGTSAPASPIVGPAAEDAEPRRGRPEGRSQERDNSVTFAQTERRPHTSHGSTGSNRAPRVGEGIPPIRPRPQTADSGARHHRLESIRAMHASSPPTRESSPSRSIRFLDTESGRSGIVSPGSNNLTVGNGARTASRSASPLPQPGERRVTD